MALARRVAACASMGGGQGRSIDLLDRSGAGHWCPSACKAQGPRVSAGGPETQQGWSGVESCQEHRTAELHEICYKEKKVQAPTCTSVQEH